MPNVEETIIIPKKEENFHDGSPESSVDSIVEADGAFDAVAAEDVNPAPVVPIKRKGGRKPIYATSEERKQRNRQAQAAFRERRTEYIKQLETTIKHQEESLQSLQQSHRTAADECLMLRYKNSLLERILLEKGRHGPVRHDRMLMKQGIDVQAELGRKETTQSNRPAHTLPRPASISKSHSRHLSRLSSGGSPLVQKVMHSPIAMSTPSSQVSSPIKSPGYGGVSVPYQSPQSIQSGKSRVAPTRSGLQAIAPNPVHGHWPSPFQSHNEQLEQEYGNQQDMLDVDEQTEDLGPGSGPGPYPQSYPQQDFSMAPTGFAIPVTTSGFPGRGDPNRTSNDSVSDSLLQDDPFGLTASMHFPTPFTFQESALRK